MKFIAPVLFAAALAFVGSAFAADPAPAKPLTAQQQKMKDCNAQAADKKGDERKAFMSQCLKATPAQPAAPAQTSSSTPAAASTATPTAANTPAPTTPAAGSTSAKQTPQQQKMTTCNAQAGDKKGADRKAFMSQCLKGDGSAAAAH